MLKKLSGIFLFIFIFIIFSPLAFSAGKQPTMTYPVKNFVVTSPYGWRVHPITGTKKFHSGVDLGCDYGDIVHAAYGGVVTDACWISGYGYTVIIDHGNGISTLYGHNQGFIVQEGQRVAINQPIAYAGSTGNSTGPHCHFEVRVFGQITNPGDYIDGLDALQDSLGSYADGSATDYNEKALTLELSADFAKPLRDFAEKIGKVFEKALSLIKDFVWEIFVILAIIDMALGFMYKTFEGDNGQSFFGYLVYKVFFLGVLVFFINNWGDFVGNFALNSFPALGSMAAGSSLEETGKILSDPTSIVQKGLFLIVPLINEAMQLKAPTSVMEGIIDGIKSMIDPMDTIIQLLCMIFGTILFFCFIFIGIQLLMAYVYFYATILFAFTGFMFSGLKQTRKFASNGLNGIFASSLNLMFFCLFSVMLQFTMQNLTVGELISSQTTTNEIGETVQIQSIDEMKMRLKAVESFGGDYTAQNPSSDAYGAYQHLARYWDGRCESYLSDGGDALCLTGKCSENPGNAPNTKFAWCPQNQDKVTEYMLMGLYDEYGDWNEVARAWNQGRGGRNNSDAWDYLGKILGSHVAVTYKTRVLAVELLMQLTMIVVMFMFMGDRISAMIQKNFGGMGFKLTNEE